MRAETCPTAYVSRGTPSRRGNLDRVRADSCDGLQQSVQ